MTTIPVMGETRAELRRPALKFSMDWITRPVFGLLLGALAIAAVYRGGVVFALFVAAIAAPAAREWHRMVTPRDFRREMLATAFAVLLASLLEALMPSTGYPWLVIICGVLANIAIASQGAGFAQWHGFGVVYLAVPTLALALLRSVDGSGFWIVVTLFAAIWASDTGALVAGNLIGGAKLCPSLSPNKTWSGFLGGIASAAIVSMAIFVYLGKSLPAGVLLGAGISLAGHAGDLFESWAKRKFKIKNSGSLIPGHGGMLDRIDSTLFAAPVLALLVLVGGFNPLAGTYP